LRDDEIRLALPAAPEYARIARLTVAGVATRLGFSYDEVEDLRIAVGEACSVLIDDPPAGRLTVVYRLGDDALEVHATADGEAEVAARAALPTADLTEQILGAVVDDHGIDVAARSVWLRKQRTDH
jgi:serine/threonine-protein kinase RsbW